MISHTRNLGWLPLRNIAFSKISRWLFAIRHALWLTQFLSTSSVISNWCPHGIKGSRKWTFGNDNWFSMQWKKQVIGKSSCWWSWHTDHMLQRKFTWHHNSLSDNKAREAGDVSLCFLCLHHPMGFLFSRCFWVYISGFCLLGSIYAWVCFVN